MNRIQIEKMYFPTASRAYSSSGGSSNIRSGTRDSFTIAPAMYSRTLTCYPNVDCLRYLDQAIITYEGSQGTLKSRGCVQHHTTSYNLTTLGLDNYIVGYENLSFVFYNPYTRYGMPCHMQMDTVGSQKELYWVDNGGNKVSKSTFASSFRLAPFWSGVTYSESIRTYLIDLVLYIEGLDSDTGVRTLTRYDGAGDNRLLPYTYDPDSSAFDGIQMNGLVMGQATIPQVSDLVRINHDISLSTDQELT
jgi:hypothetical protein